MCGRQAEKTWRTKHEHWIVLYKDKQDVAIWIVIQNTNRTLLSGLLYKIQTGRCYLGCYTKYKQDVDIWVVIQNTNRALIFGLLYKTQKDADIWVVIKNTNRALIYGL